MYMKTSKMFNTSPYLIKREDKYKTAVGSNSTDQWYWVLYICNADDTEQSFNVNVQWKITYYALFSRYGAVSQS